MVDGARPYCKVDQEATPDDYYSSGGEGNGDGYSNETGSRQSSTHNDGSVTTEGFAAPAPCPAPAPTAADGPSQQRTCCGRLRYEMAAPVFAVEEPRGGSSRNRRRRRYVDIQKTFCPEPIWFTRLSRVCFLSASVQVLIQTLLLETPPNNRYFFMAYLTHWGLVVAIAYQLAALLCATLRARCGVLRQPTISQGGGDDDGGCDNVHVLVRITWALFALAAPAETIITILFWCLDYSAGQPVTYDLIMRHGGVCALLLVDGFVLGGRSIPLRIRQVFLLVGFCVCYLTWTVIFAVTDIVDPNMADDDAIYAVLAWNKDPEGAAILSALCGFVLPPLVFLFFWAVSLSRRRCIYQGDHCDGRSRGNAVEMEMATFIREEGKV